MNMYALRSTLVQKGRCGRCGCCRPDGQTWVTAAQSLYCGRDWRCPQASPPGLAFSSVRKLFCFMPIRIQHEEQTAWGLLGARDHSLRLHHLSVKWENTMYKPLQMRSSVCFFILVRKDPEWGHARVWRCRLAVEGVPGSQRTVPEAAQAVTGG